MEATVSRSALACCALPASCAPPTSFSNNPAPKSCTPQVWLAALGSRLPWVEDATPTDMRHACWLRHYWRCWEEAGPAAGADAEQAQLQREQRARRVIQGSLLHPLVFLLLGPGSHYVLSALCDCAWCLWWAHTGLISVLLNREHHSQCMGLQARQASREAAVAFRQDCCPLTRHTRAWHVLWPRPDPADGRCGPPGALTRDSLEQFAVDALFDGLSA